MNYNVAQPTIVFLDEWAGHPGHIRCIVAHYIPEHWIGVSKPGLKHQSYKYKDHN